MRHELWNDLKISILRENRKLKMENNMAKGNNVAQKIQVLVINGKLQHGK